MTRHAKKRRRSEQVELVNAHGESAGLHWIVVETHTGKEKWATMNLRKSGFEVYLPMRLSKRRDGAQVPVPFFPRYIFVRASNEVERWQVIFSTDGVSRVMGLGNRPIGLRNSFIRQIKAHEIGGYLKVGLVPGKPRCDLKQDERVIVEIGGAAIPGLFQGVDGRRVDVLLKLLSSDSRVTVDLSRVAREAG